jgi:hypothetical protein
MTRAHEPTDAVHSDERWQFAVLSLVLRFHPERLSATELRREMLAGDYDFAKTDSHNRAVRDLIAAGLLRHDGDSIVATRAAMHFDMLND